MIRLIVLLPVALLWAAGCTSYKKLASRSEIIDNKVELNNLAFKHVEGTLGTSMWQNKRIIVTDIEFYPNEGGLVGSNMVSDFDGSDDAQEPTPHVLAAPVDNPLKRIRHIVVESFKEEQASSKALASDGSLEVSKVHINEQENIKEESKPVANSGIKYSFIVGIFVALMAMLGLRKLL